LAALSVALQASAGGDPDGDVGGCRHCQSAHRGDWLPARPYSTTTVDLEFWNEWKAAYVGYPPLKTRAVFEARSEQEAASKALFGQGDLSDLDEATLAAALSQLPKTTIARGSEFPTWVDLLTATGVVASKSAARRIVQENGAYLNNAKISGEAFAPSDADLIHGRFLVLRKGKRDLASVEVI